MIVTPEFLDHWKTQLLVKTLKDQTAPLLVIRLWSYCQTQKKWVLDGITPEILGLVLKTKKDAEGVVKALKTCGFLDEVNGVLVVHEWEVYNSKLLAAWNNGKTGGRPPKPMGLIKKPMDNPQLTQAKPKRNRLDRIGEDRIGEEGKDKKEGEENTSSLSEKLPSLHTELISLWDETYRSAHGFDYRFTGGRDGKAVKGLLGLGLTPAQAIELAAAAWKCQGWACKAHSHTIHGLHDRINEIRNELNGKSAEKKEIKETVPIRLL